ncbi:hypothetical protein V6N13_004940 [Hibiscus sabdariffa]|uniref:Uncharacterized protein n=1 Tax=Hibiscus sabdariffa TaxID=183260 RepID=A0ABR2S031_9ROSI
MHATPPCIKGSCSKQQLTSTHGTSDLSPCSLHQTATLHQTCIKAAARKVGTIIPEPSSITRKTFTIQLSTHSQDLEGIPTPTTISPSKSPTFIDLPSLKPSSLCMQQYVRVRGDESTDSLVHWKEPRGNGSGVGHKRRLTMENPLPSDS